MIFPTNAGLDLNRLLRVKKTVPSGLTSFKDSALSPLHLLTSELQNTQPKNSPSPNGYPH